MSAPGRRTWVIVVGVLCVSIAGVPLTAQASYTVFQPTRINRAQQPAVTLTVRDSTVEYVVNEIARQAGMRVAYGSKSNAILVRTTRVSVHLNQVPIAAALAMVVRGTDLAAQIAPDGETIMVRAKGATADERTRQSGGVVAGWVMDSTTGAGLTGAQVRVGGVAKLTTVTSDSGRFVLRNVPPGDQVLQVRLFGYRPATRTVTVVDGERTSVRIAMAPVPTVLSGVVTTATGTQKKVEVGSDITTLNADSIMQVAPVQTVTDLLETRVPGLTVLHSSGAPGDPSRLRLRGPGSLQLNNDPILIVDGIRVYANQSDPRNQNLAPGIGNLANTGTHYLAPSFNKYNAPSPLDQVDPNTIETIEVMKGPSASAIYGSDAASGVIIITTKHGRAGPTHWNLALNTGVNWLPGRWPVNYYAFGESNNFFCNWFDPRCHVDSLVPFQALNDPRYTVFAHGSDRQATLTVSGGNSTLLYALTGSGSGDVGNLKLPLRDQALYDSLYGQTYGKIPHDLVRPDQYTTWGVSGSLTANPYQTLSVVLRSGLFKSNQGHSSLESAIPSLQGEYVSPIVGIFQPGSFPVVGPLVTQEYERATDDGLSTTSAASLNWTPASWLPLTAMVGINTIQRHDVTYVPFGIYNGEYSIGFNGGGNGLTPNSPGDTTGYYGVGQGESHDQTVTVGTTMPLLRQRISLALGGNLHGTSTTDFSTFTNQLAPGVSVPTQFMLIGPGYGCVGTCFAPTSQTTSDQSTYGWYVEPHFNVASRFFVAPGFRLDGGSGAATSAGSVGGLSGFPKMDLSYVAVDRQGDRPLWGFLTQLRPRLSFGIAGTQPRPADKLRLYNVGLANYEVRIPGQGNITDRGNCAPTLSLDGTTSTPATCLNALGNTQLRPERSSELEGGFDASFWRNRLQVTYTQYNKTRHDAILAIPVAPSVFGVASSGVAASIEKNIGEVRNTGTELTVTAQVLETRAIGWTVGANFSNDNNLVVRLNKGQNPIVLQSDVGQTGYETRVEAGYPLFGVFTHPILGFADANGDGVIESSEIVYGDSTVYIGQPNPKGQLNLTSDVALLNGRLSVHATVAYQGGATQNNVGACRGVLALLPNAPGTTLATQAAIVASGCVSGSGVTDPRSAVGFVQTVSTLRFNDLSINYTVPTAVASWFRVPRMTVALQGSNLALHTNYRGFDPNVNAFSTVSAGDETIDAGQMPQPRTWWLRLTLGN